MNKNFDEVILLRKMMGLYMDLKDYDKLKKLMGMTGSSQDGEALNALRLANGILMKHNLSWEDIFSSKVTVQVAQGTTSSSPPKGSPKLDPDEVNEMFDLLLRKISGGKKNLGTSGSFGDFINSLHDQWEAKGYLTQKQYDALKKSYDRQAHFSNI